MRAVDRAGLENFAARLQAAMLAAGVVPPALVPGMGFWNRRRGLGLLVVLLLLSLGLAGVVVCGLFSGAMRHRGGQAAAMLVMLPVGAGWMLRRAWRRRREALRPAAPVQLAGPQASVAAVVPSPR
jgi:hypothetical protein